MVPAGALKASAIVFPGLSFGSVRMRLRMLIEARRSATNLQPFLNPASGGTLDQLMQARPQMLGCLLWPYQNASWNAPERLDRIAAHCSELDQLGAPFTFAPDTRLVIAELDHMMPELRVVLDQPLWFMREGGLTLNLFVGSFRAFSVAFSFFRDPATGQRAAYIGAVQGRGSADALDLYRQLTKTLHGMRPRDFLIDVLRMILKATNAKYLQAVSDSARHHRHPYFGATNLSQDYDAIWQDRGGSALDASTFEIPVAPQHRPLDEIKSKKRSLYRQRYAFLDAFEAQLIRNLPTLTPVQFPDS